MAILILSELQEVVIGILNGMEFTLKQNYGMHINEDKMKVVE